MKHASRTVTKWMAAQDLEPHPLAQRKISQAHIRELTECFDLDIIGTIHVVDYEIPSLKRRALWVVDGQHRWRILMDIGFGELAVQVCLHEDCQDDARASEIFLGLNKKKTIAPYDTFKNELTANNPTATNIVSILKARGVKVGPSAADGYACCVASLKNTYNLDGGRSLALVMDTVVPAWGKAMSALEGKLIEGLGKVYSVYNGTIDRAVMIRKLAKYPGGSAGLLGDARGLRNLRKGSVASCVVEVVVERYNSGRTTGRLENPPF